MNITFDKNLKAGYANLSALASLRGYAAYKLEDFFKDYKVVANTEKGSNNLFFNAIRKESGYIVPNE